MKSSRLELRKSQRLFLKVLQPSDCSEKYLSWFHDQEVIKFLSIRSSIPKTINDLKNFVSSCYISKSILLLGIFDTKSNAHIGNIKLSNLIQKHSGEIGILIGNRKYWGRGIASESIKILTEYAGSTFGLVYVYAGAREDNVGSIKAFLKSGFQIHTQKEVETEFKDISKTAFILRKYFQESKKIQE